MTINVLKRRRLVEDEFKNITYMAHPFAKTNGIRLLNDIHLNKILSLESLSTDLDIASKEKQNAVPRLKKSTNKEFNEF